MISDASSAVLRQLTRLRFVKFVYNKNISDRMLRDLAHLPDLRSLSCVYCSGITDQGIQHLTALRGCLEYLSVWYCTKISSACADALAQMQVLKALDVANCDLLDDQFLFRLAASPTVRASLMSVNIWGCAKVTDAGVVQLARFSHLVTLCLANCKLITNEGVQPLTRLDNLISLNIMNCDGVTADVVAPSRACWMR